MDFLISGILTAGRLYTGSLEKKEMVNKLISLEREQAKLFDMFANEIKAIQEGPFYTGLTYLEEAAEEHRTKKDEMKMVKSALEQFIKAYGIQRAKLKKTAFDIHFIGFIQSYISITWLMLNSPKDALNWMEKSIVSLQKGQKLFANDIEGLNQEIRAIELEGRAYDRKVSESYVAAGLDFFFGNKSLEGKKQQLPKYRNLVSRYSLAKKESKSYLEEMVILKSKIEEEIDSYQGAKNQLEDKITSLITTTIRVPKESFKKTLEVLPNDSKDYNIKSVFNKIKNKASY